MSDPVTTSPHSGPTADDDESAMRLAIAEARIAGLAGEVPVGAVVVVDGTVVASGHNEREKQTDPTAHAELIAIRQAARVLGSWRMENATLYVLGKDRSGVSAGVGPLITAFADIDGERKPIGSVKLRGFALA